ncbi:MAG: rhamnulokinase, partial [Clostridia bacterium]|nr:rhamnulokinase [Clostridia bacterium]
AEKLEELTGKKYNFINIVGGGTKDELLCRFTANGTGRKVLAGPVEATAAGNLMVQLMYLDKGLNLTTARELIKNSFGKN